MDMWSLVVSVLAVLAAPCCSHVGLYYPPARTYALDFLDNVRTQWPCGMQRGGCDRVLTGPFTRTICTRFEHFWKKYSVEINLQKAKFHSAIASSELVPNMFEAGSCQIPLH